MLTDEALFETYIQNRSVSTLHIYEWASPCITVGFTQKTPPALMPGTNCPVIRRPTGGGAVLHGFDTAFSIIAGLSINGIPRSYTDSYRFLNEILLEALKDFIVSHGAGRETLSLWEKKEKPSACCYSYPTLYDIVAGCSKVAGAAQRRKKDAILYQATVSFTKPSLNFWNAGTGMPLQSLCSKPASKEKLHRCIVKSYEKAFNCSFKTAPLSPQERKYIDSKLINI